MSDYAGQFHAALAVVKLLAAAKVDFSRTDMQIGVTYSSGGNFQDYFGTDRLHVLTTFSLQWLSETGDALAIHEALSLRFDCFRYVMGNS